jgi:hypothetical protein
MRSLTAGGQGEDFREPFVRVQTGRLAAISRETGSKVAVAPDLKVSICGSSLFTADRTASFCP